MTFYLFFYPPQDRSVLAEEIWPGGVVMDSTQSPSWLQAKSTLSERHGEIELTLLQELLLKGKRK